MQPVLYLMIRAWISVLQAVEIRNRAFSTTTAVVVAQGAAHCWAIVYGMIIAVMMQSTRRNGYHNPDDTSGLLTTTENLASTMMLVWMWGGCAMVCLRFLQVDEQSMGLPVHRGDTACPCPKLWEAVRSPKARKLVHLVYTVTGAGLFLSVVLLAISMFSEISSCHVCDICLLTISLSFAIPHAIMATRRILLKGETPFNNILLAVCREASALGPQMSVVFAVADVRKEAPSWQNVFHILATAAYVFSLVAASQKPVSREGYNEPSSIVTIICSIIVDCLATAMLGMVFPVLRDWFFMACLLASVVAVASLFNDVAKTSIIEILEPIMPFISNQSRHKFPEWMKTTRTVVQILAVVSALVASQSAWSENYLWSVPSQHSAPHFDHHDHHNSGHLDGHDGNFDDHGRWYDHDSEGHWDSDHHIHHDDDSDDDGSYESYWKRDWLALRWHPKDDEISHQDMVQSIATAFNKTFKDIRTVSRLDDARVMIFRLPINEDEIPHHDLWASARNHEVLKNIADASFPLKIDRSTCERLYHATIERDHLEKDPELSEAEVEAINSPEFAGSPDPKAAVDSYTKVCHTLVSEGEYIKHYTHDYHDDGHSDETGESGDDLGDIAHQFDHHE